MNKSHAGFDIHTMLIIAGAVIWAVTVLLIFPNGRLYVWPPIAFVPVTLLGAISYRQQKPDRTFLSALGESIAWAVFFPPVTVFFLFFLDKRKYRR